LAELADFEPPPVVFFEVKVDALDVLLPVLPFV
jgi:hypothetical protein